MHWKDAGVVERAALEMRCTGNCTGGSNPSLSAKKRSKEMSILSASFCFCSTTHTNLFVGCGDVKTKVVDLSTTCVVLILQGARRRGKGTDDKPRAENTCILCRGAKEEKEFKDEQRLRYEVNPSFGHTIGQPCSDFIY